MKILTKANYLKNKPNCFEHNSGKDNVDRSDYISPEEQYYRLILAGVQLKRGREELHDFDSVVEEYKTNRLFTRYMDKIDAVEKYRDKLHQYNTVKKQTDRLKELRARYLEEMEQIHLQNQIKNDLHSDVIKPLTKDTE